MVVHTSDEENAGPEEERQAAKHEITVRSIQRIRVDEVVEALRHQTHCHALIQHAWAHSIEDVWFHLQPPHKTVNHHQYINSRHII